MTPFGGQDEIEIAEDRFLDLAGIARAADEHDFAAEIDRDDGLRPAAVPLGIGAEGGQIEDRQSGTKLACSARDGRIRRLRMKRECQAYSVMTRTFTRCAGSAPP